MNDAVHAFFAEGLGANVTLPHKAAAFAMADIATATATRAGTANVLTRTTAFLAAGFFLTSLLLSILASWERKPRAILPNAPAGQTQPAGAPAPLGQGGGVLDQLRGGGQGGGQEAPPAPSGPQVPRSQ